MSAAKWHREQVKSHHRCPDIGCAAIRAHHAVAADALDALAVPGVAELLAAVAKVEMFTTIDRRGDGTDHEPIDQQRASLAALAKIAKEAK